MPKRKQATENQPLDPIPMALAIWLGVIVGVTGLIRLSEDAAIQAQIARSAGGPAGVSTADEVQPFNPRLMAFGG